MVTPPKEATERLYVLLLPSQHFSGLKKHFSAPECVFFFPLPGLPPNRSDIEFTCKKVLVHKCHRGFALTNTYLLTFQDRSPTFPTEF